MTNSPNAQIPDAVSPGNLGPLLEQAAICDVLQHWGMWRDRCDWDALRSVYAPDATMQTTWMDGPATEFVDVSQRMSAGPVRAQHYIGVPTVKLNGDRALAQTRITILVRGPLNGVEVDASCHGWFVDRMVKINGQWQILSRAPIYEKDTLVAVDPGVTLKLDADKLALYPPHYKHMAYMQSVVGAPINLDLPRPGSTEQDRMLKNCEEWLAAGGD
ncbi:MAG: nuclear transport factor 2 family protein [Rubrivivax sp.]